MSLDEMSRLRANGMTCREIAAELGCSKSHVHRMLSRAGLIEPRYRLPVGRAVALLNRGYSVRQVAAIIGCSENGLRHRLMSIGYRAATQVKVDPAEAGRMVTMWQQGMSMADVGRRLGRHPDTVRNHLCRAGVYEKRARLPMRRHPWAAG